MDLTVGFNTIRPSAKSKFPKVVTPKLPQSNDNFLQDYIPLTKVYRLNRDRIVSDDGHMI
jgi:hypothetical protein